MPGQSAGTEVKHGATGYRNGCRCQVCKDAKMAYMRSDKQAAYRKGWASQNRDKTRAKHKRWRDKNACSERARTRQWFRDNPAYMAEYYTTPRGKALRASRLAAYRAITRNIAVEHLDLIRRIYEACPEGYEVDHVVPVAKGGRHVPDNLQYLPASENKRKGARTDYAPKGAIQWRDILPSTTIPVEGVGPSGPKRTASRNG